MLAAASRCAGDCCPVSGAANFGVSCNSTTFGSCNFVAHGCTDRTAFNYLSQAVVDDGTCEYPKVGCTIIPALNYDSTAALLSVPDTCVFVKPGCTDPTANNYIEEANTDDGTCTYSVFGCTDDTALNFDSIATVTSDCSYAVFGCMSSSAANYDSDAVFPVECEYEVMGCMSPAAMNYDSSATREYGGCLIFSPPPSPPPPLMPPSPPPPPLSGAQSPSPPTSIPSPSLPPTSSQASDLPWLLGLVGGLALIALLIWLFGVWRRGRRSKPLLMSKYLSSDDGKTAGMITFQGTSRPSAQQKERVPSKRSEYQVDRATDKSCI